jgi:large subunit ribosomal protein L27
MAHKKAGSTTRKNRDSNSKRLGVKKYGGEKVSPGNIIVRQKGSKFHSGEGTMRGNDWTIFAIQEGTVTFKQKLGKKVITVSQNS